MGYLDPKLGSFIHPWVSSTLPYLYHSGLEVVFLMYFLPFPIVAKKQPNLHQIPWKRVFLQTINSVMPCVQNRDA